jgi:hypothetical protein
MDYLMLAWMFAGVGLGFYLPQIIMAAFKVRTPIWADLFFAFVGWLIVYSIF